MESGEEISCGVLVACGDTSELLDEIEESLDEVALGIEGEAAVALDLAVGLRRNDNFDRARFEAGNEAAGVIALAAQKGSGLDLSGQGFGLRDVMDLAAGEA